MRNPGALDNGRSWLVKTYSIVVQGALVCIYIYTHIYLQIHIDIFYTTQHPNFKELQIQSIYIYIHVCMCIGPLVEVHWCCMVYLYSIALLSFEGLFPSRAYLCGSPLIGLTAPSYVAIYIYICI